MKRYMIQLNGSHQT